MRTYKEELTMKKLVGVVAVYRDLKKSIEAYEKSGGKTKLAASR